MFGADDIQATLGQLVKQTFGHVAKSVFEPCGHVGCTAASPGWSCSECQKPTCTSHGFFTLPTPKHPRPVVVCLECITPAPREAPPAPRAKRRER